MREKKPQTHDQARIQEKEKKEKKRKRGREGEYILFFPPMPDRGTRETVCGKKQGKIAKAGKVGKNGSLVIFEGTR